jgi:hypothetical protein
LLTAFLRLIVGDAQVGHLFLIESAAGMLRQLSQGQMRRRCASRRRDG